MTFTVKIHRHSSWKCNDFFFLQATHIAIFESTVRLAVTLLIWWANDDDDRQSYQPNSETNIWLNFAMYFMRKGGIKSH